MGTGLSFFINPPSMLIVVGGTIAATSVAFPAKELFSVGSVTKRVFRNPKQEMIALVKFLMDCRKTAAKEGSLALENLAKKAPGGAAKALQLVVDGADSSSIEQILSTERRTIEEHHRVGQKIFSEMGKLAPAFGMVGTLIGLVQMLATLDDPSTIGPKMAVALLTTFYGAVLSNLFFLPMVIKLERRLKIELEQLQLIQVGMLCISSQDSLVIMRAKLKAYLALQGDKVDEVLKGK
jgi:chemotaxis protein MotA